MHGVRFGACSAVCFDHGAGEWGTQAPVRNLRKEPLAEPL